MLPPPTSPYALDTVRDTRSSSISGGRSYSELRTATVYAAVKNVSTMLEVDGHVVEGSLPSSIFSSDCAVTFCFFLRSLMCGTKISKSIVSREAGQPE